MEHDFGIDLQDIYQVIDSAEVVLVRFQLIEQRLLVDMRHSGMEGPLLRLVPRAGSAEERFRSLKRLRPRFPVPDRIMSFQWPRQITSLKESGVWARICDRLASTGADDIGRTCDDLYRELLRLERDETIAAIRGGEGYETVWARKD